MSKKVRGFTLIELLVVVAILGILASVGVVAYSGYVQSAKLKTVENLMQQINLAQTEFFADNGANYPTGADVASPCSATAVTSGDIETNLLGGSNVITGSDLGFNFCISKTGANYLIEASDSLGTMSLSSANVVTKYTLNAAEEAE